jgi:hypothetical protein
LQAVGKLRKKGIVRGERNNQKSLSWNLHSISSSFLSSRKKEMENDEQSFVFE